MRPLFKNVLDKIPDYQCFLTPAELDASSRALAEEYPEQVEVFTMGKTRSGQDLLCLKIGQGSRNALMFGCPHPNEPIGTMLLEFFSRELVENQALREDLDYSWYIVKAWDRDGLELNEGWLKGPFNASNYSRHFFRPAGHQQVDWTYPVDYKELHFHRTLPETQAMMDLIDQIQPEFIFSLHNSGFGGVYWYVTHKLVDETYAAMRQLAAEQEIPLHLGEPELPYLKELAPAVYSFLNIKADYDYLEEFKVENIGQVLNVGDCTASYALEKCNAFTLLTELPYFYSAQISDQRPSDRLRRDVVLEALAEAEAGNRYKRDLLEKTRDLVAADNPYRLALEAFSKDAGLEAARQQAMEDPDFQRPATLAETFDSLDLQPFYQSLSYGMAISMLERELEQMDPAEQASSDKARALKELIVYTSEEHRKLTEQVEQKLDYQVIPIQKLIRIQLGCGLLVCDFIREHRQELEPLAN